MQELVENIEGEVWKVLPDTDERFFVSNKGRIKKITVLVWDDNGNPKPWKEHLVYNNSVRIDAVPIAFNKNGKRYVEGVAINDIYKQTFPEFCYEPPETMLEPTNLENEEWKEIPGTFGKYKISNLGRLKSCARITIGLDGKRYERSEKILVVPIGTTGYKRVVLDLGHDENGKRLIKSLAIHRAVAQLFLPNPDGKEQVNHKDGIKTNNDVTNLEWNTPKENVQHAFRTGLAYARQGVEANRAKIKSDADVEKLKDMYFSGKSVDDVGKEFGISGTEVLDIVKGNRFKSHFSQEEYDRRMEIGRAHV